MQELIKAFQAARYDDEQGGYSQMMLAEHIERMDKADFEKLVESVFPKLLSSRPVGPYFVIEAQNRIDPWFVLDSHTGWAKSFMNIGDAIAEANTCILGVVVDNRMNRMYVRNKVISSSWTVRTLTQALQDALDDKNKQEILRLYEEAKDVNMDNTDPLEFKHYERLITKCNLLVYG